MEYKDVIAKLQKTNSVFNTSFPGDSGDRQPVHTVYGGAHLFTSVTAHKMSETALRNLEEYAPQSKTFASLFGPANGNPTLWEKVYSRVIAKLKREAVEDFRIDFEDGYGNRTDSEEDGHAQAAAIEAAKGMAEKTLPPFIGIRIKPLSNECAARSLRTLDLFVKTLADKTGGKLPSNFVVTLPKITNTGQAVALTQALEILEQKTGLKTGSLKFEIMVETTQAIMSDRGTCPLRDFADAGKGRCTGAHFGTYDYTASSNITALYQAMDHSVCDFAKHIMKVAFAGTGIMLSDGATNIMPVGPHKGTLTAAQRSENEAVVHRAWKLSHSHIRHSLINGYYQGWDLHPAQLPIRYATIYSFFLESLEPMTTRLKLFVEKAARATLLGDVFDDAATGQGLLNFFLRGLSCGAISESEALATGLTLEEIQSRSFLKILDGRRG